MKPSNQMELDLLTVDVVGVYEAVESRMQVLTLSCIEGCGTGIELAIPADAHPIEFAQACSMCKNNQVSTGE